MGETKHTPGPWDYWDMDEFGFHVFATKFGTRKEGQDCRLSVAAVRYGRSHQTAAENFYEADANARLIAAAPDMLAALKGAMVIIDIVPRPEGMGEAVHKALDERRKAVLAAISKAEVSP